MQTCMAYFFWLAYGTLATILCPLRTWSIFFAIMLWHQVDTMPYSCLRYVLYQNLDILRNLNY